MELANFFEVKGLSSVDEQVVLEKNTISLGDYGSFFNFFLRDKGMSKEEIIDTFLWVAHPHFTHVINIFE